MDTAGPQRVCWQRGQYLQLWYLKNWQLTPSFLPSVHFSWCSFLRSLTRTLQRDRHLLGHRREPSDCRQLPSLPELNADWHQNNTDSGPKSPSPDEPLKSNHGAWSQLNYYVRVLLLLSCLYQDEKLKKAWFKLNKDLSEMIWLGCCQSTSGSAKRDPCISMAKVNLPRKKAYKRAALKKCPCILGNSNRKTKKILNLTQWKLSIWGVLKDHVRLNRGENTVSHLSSRN